MFDWVQNWNQTLLYAYYWFNYRTQIKPIIASDPVHFIEQ